MNISLEDYLPRLLLKKEKLSKNKPVEFKSGYLGKLMINSLKPVSEGAKAIKTFKVFIPTKLSDSSYELERFQKNTKALYQLWTDVKQCDLNKARVASALGPWLQFRYGVVIEFTYAS